MPPNVNDDLPFSFDRAGIERVIRTVRFVEGMGAYRNPPPGYMPPAPDLLVLAKNDGSTFTKGTTKTITLYGNFGDTIGSETSTPLTFNNVYNRMADIGANKWMYLFRVQKGYEVITAEC